MAVYILKARDEIPVKEVRAVIIRGIMIMLLFSIIIVLPAFIFVTNYVYEKQLKRSAAVISRIKKSMIRLGL